ncbi:MAG: UDP-N-acetylmuramoylalanine--D-glutamate ligase [Parcubacteria group bacterium Gr01-1014_2]|nr:MAG: UDP-N-acetylmuramoylalanine--D-glutamate ligase [Parcubacteria group bacterium Gr01-1014_2]
MSTKELINKKIAILGSGKEGLSTLKFLKKNKIKADILDVKFDKNYTNRLKNYDIVFRTPGFPRLHPALVDAEKNGVIISSHIKLFFDLCPARVIGITGTKGKTTTAFLIYNILKSKFGKNVFIAGNFGEPALEILPKLNNKSLVILELSSFQLQDLHKSPQVAVITNITLDHLDPIGQFRPNTHQTAKEYIEAKLNIIRYQKNNDFAVIHPSLKKGTINAGKGKKIFPTPLPLEIPIGKANRGSSISQSDIGTKLKGPHNLENIALAVEVGKIFKVPKEKMLKAVQNFKGIEHRLEFVKKINGISFYNDSAATNPDATLAALKSFKEPTHLILGGFDKGLDYKNLAGYISRSKNIKTIALIGQLKEKLYRILKPKSKLKIKKFKSLKDTVLTLYKKADKNEVVLLSPGAASFDMFSGYAQRGREFKKIVKQLKGADDVT